MEIRKKYTIYFGRENSNSNKLNEILEADNFSEKEKFIFIDYDSKQSIKNLKNFFLSIFGYKYEYCSCLIDLFILKPGSFQNKFSLIIDDELKKLNELNTEVLYLIKRNRVCKCEDKIIEYLLKLKSELISDLKKYKKTNDLLSHEKEKLKNSNIQLEKRIKELKERINILEKKNEINNNYLAENFYDVIIDLKSKKRNNKRMEN